MCPITCRIGSRPLFRPNITLGQHDHSFGDLCMTVERRLNPLGEYPTDRLLVGLPQQWHILVASNPEEVECDRVEFAGEHLLEFAIR